MLPSEKFYICFSSTILVLNVLRDSIWIESYGQNFGSVQDCPFFLCFCFGCSSFFRNPSAGLFPSSDPLPHLSWCFPHGLLHLEWPGGVLLLLVLAAAWIAWDAWKSSGAWIIWPRWVISAPLHLFINFALFCIVFAWFPPFLIIQLKIIKYGENTQFIRNN